MSYICTATGVHFDPVHPDPDKISIKDIAHSLAYLCRGGGHSRIFYSVAQHCIACAREAAQRGLSERIQLGCLLHDAAEAYIQDVTRPLKEVLPEYCAIENGLQQCIYNHFLTLPLSDEELQTVKDIDDDMLDLEFHQIMPEDLGGRYMNIVSNPVCKEENPSEIALQYEAFAADLLVRIRGTQIHAPALRPETGLVRQDEFQRKLARVLGMFAQGESAKKGAEASDSGRNAEASFGDASDSPYADRSYAGTETPLSAEDDSDDEDARADNITARADRGDGSRNSEAPEEDTAAITDGTPGQAGEKTGSRPSIEEVARILTNAVNARDKAEKEKAGPLSGEDAGILSDDESGTYDDTDAEVSSDAGTEAKDTDAQADDADDDGMEMKRAYVVHMLQDGYDPTNIAYFCGVSEDYVRALAKTLGIDIHNH